MQRCHKSANVDGLFKMNIKLQTRQREVGFGLREAVLPSRHLHRPVNIYMCLCVYMCHIYVHIMRPPWPRQEVNRPRTAYTQLVNEDYKHSEFRSQ